MLKHIPMMAFGLLAHWITEATPVRWWYEPGQPLWWMLPHAGYFAFHPHEWWRPQPRREWSEFPATPRQ